MRSRLEIGWRNGIIVKNQKNRLVFDPISKSCIRNGDVIFISHSHADHTLGFTLSEKKYSTDESKKIFERIRNRNVRNFIPIKVNQTIDFDVLKVTPINAGHMLGSVQYKIESPNSTVLYTGDINCVDTLTTKKADEAECDILIIEATFGDPAYIFPQRESTYVEIIKWSLEKLNQGKIPIFHVYAASKAQELIKIFNEFTNLEVIAHPKISRVNEIYSENGIKLEYLNSYPEMHVCAAKIIKKRSCVYVTFPSDRELNFRNGVEAVATGWAIKEAFKSVRAFPLSGHADFKQLVSFVENSRAKRVYVYTGFRNNFASYLSNKLGIKAGPLPSLPYRDLGDFLFERKMSVQT